MIRIFNSDDINEHAEAIRKKEEKKEQLQKIILSRMEFEKSKIDDREIILGNKMFDIKTLTIDGEFVYITGYFDEHETSLLSAIKEIFDFGHDGSNKTMKYKVLDFWYTQSEELFNLEITDENFYNLIDSVFNSLYPETASPPPKSFDSFFNYHSP
jgi:hypothetical protein